MNEESDPNVITPMTQNMKQKKTLTYYCAIKICQHRTFYKFQVSKMKSILIGTKAELDTHIFSLTYIFA